MEILDEKTGGKYIIEYQTNSSEDVGELEKDVQNFFSLYSLNKPINQQDKSSLFLLVTKIPLDDKSLSICPTRICEIGEIVLKSGITRKPKFLKATQRGVLIQGY